MYSQQRMKSSIKNDWQQIEAAQEALAKADAVLIGAGSGLSTAAGFCYDGPLFAEHFADFIQKYHFTDLYTAGFYPYPSLEEFWAYWSRHIYYNRYDSKPNAVYQKLYELVQNKDYFVLTTNVDHQFQLSGFAKERLFYTQGDYGLWQCSVPCHQKTYDNEEAVRRMVAEQKNMRIPTEAIPYCPLCGQPMSMNLHCDHTFVQDAGWYAAQSRYEAFLAKHQTDRVLYWELGVGGNTPGIIKFPFWQMTASNQKAQYLCCNWGEAFCPLEIAQQSICIKQNIATVLAAFNC